MFIPRRPHFVVFWRGLGHIDPALSVLTDHVLTQARGIYLIFTEQEERRLQPQYLGMTFGQTFAQRIGQHLRGLARLGAAVPERRRLYVGIVHPQKYRALSRKMLSEIEHLLIWAVKPQGNNAQRRPYDGREMLLENDGDDFGMPRFLYANSLGPAVVFAQGPSPDRMSQKIVHR